jgi:hypothetical protein
MKKRNLKAIFLGLLSRRRAGDKSSPGRSMPGAPQDVAATRSRIEAAASDQKAPQARAETISATGGRLPQTPPGPPADWLAKRSSGPPSHWAERVRPAAPELLQDCERSAFEAAPPPRPPRQVLLRPPQSQGPALAPVSTRRPEQPSAATSDRARHEFRKQEPPAPSSSAGAQKGDAELSDRRTDKPPRFGPSRLANNSGTIWKIVPRISASVGRATESPRMSPPVPLKVGRAVAIEPQEAAEMAAAPLLEVQAVAAPASLPSDNVRRPNVAGPSGPARKDQLTRSSRNGDEYDFPRGAPAPSEMRRICDGDEAPLHIPIISAGPSRIVKFSRRQTPKPENASRENITRYSEVIRREDRSLPVSPDWPAFNSGSRRVKNMKEVTEPMKPRAAQDRPDASYDVSPGRWPELLQSSPGDYFDDLMAVLRELRHNRRLAGEQAGNLWSE